MVMNEVKSNGELPVLPCWFGIKSLELSGENLVISKKSETTSIPIRNIASFKLSRGGGSARITLTLQKGSDAFAGVGMFAVSLGSEIAINFKPEYWDIAKMYETHVHNFDMNPSEVAEVPTINDLRALKQLVNEGVLTEEEFTAKKRQLLGI